MSYTLKNKVANLYAAGYETSAIAEELGITASKAQKLVDEVEHTAGEATTPSPTTAKSVSKVHKRKLTRAIHSLKEDFDDIVATLHESDGETVSLEQLEEYLEGVRTLEFEFRKTAKDFHLDCSESEHRLFLLELIEELKASLEEVEEEEVELDFDEELLESADDLRFELIEFSDLDK